MFLTEDCTISALSDDDAPSARPQPSREVRCDGCCQYPSRERCAGCGRLLCADCLNVHRYDSEECHGRPIVDDGSDME